MEQAFWNVFTTLLCAVVWFGCGLINNASLKVILTEMPYPITFSTLQISTGLFYSAITAYMNSGKQYFVISNEVGMKMVLLGAVQVGTKLLHQVALTIAPVSFVHTVKVSAPIFTIILSHHLIGEKPSSKVIVSVIPIILGVTLCSATSGRDFTLAGFVISAIGTLFFCVGHVLAKKTMMDLKVTELTMIIYTDLITFILMLPLWCIFDGYMVLELILHSNIGYVVLLNGLVSFGQSIFALIVLSRVSTLTYSILNVSKRAVVISGSILYFGTQVGFLSATGIAVALVGVLLYTKAKYEENEPNSKIIESVETNVLNTCEKEIFNLTKGTI